VLRNKASIKDLQQLEAYEDACADVAVIDTVDAMAGMKLDFDMWKQVHGLLFAEVYDWAGQVRSVQMSKGTSLFAHPEYIEAAAVALFKQLAADLPDMSPERPEQLAHKLAYYYTEMNAIHPFREGNGRTQKMIINEIARRAGAHIPWEKLDVEQHLRATMKAFAGDDSAMKAQFLQVLERI
jgi:cell filamentation protein